MSATLSRNTTLAATLVAALVASTSAHAISIHSNRSNAPGQQVNAAPQGNPNGRPGGPGQPNDDNGGGAGNLCDPGQGQSFTECTWNGSPTIMKFNVGGSWAVNPDEAGPGWDVTPVELLTDLDPSANVVTYSLNGFVVTFTNVNGGPRIVSWSYDNSGSLVTYWHVKYGGAGDFQVQGDGTPVSSGTFDGSNIQTGISHITFFDSGEKQIPEPGSLALLGLGVAGLGLARRRKDG